MNNSIFVIGFTPPVKKVTHRFMVDNPIKYTFVFQVLIKSRFTRC